MSDELKNSIVNRGGPLPPPPHDWQKRWRELEQRAARLEIELEMAVNDFNREKQRAIAAEQKARQHEDELVELHELRRTLIAAKEAAEQTVGQLREKLAHDRDKSLAPLRAIIPQTYGEAVLLSWIPGIEELPNHEWDNRTTEENAAWVITQLQTALNGGEPIAGPIERCNVCGRELMRSDERAIGACAVCMNEEIEE